MPPSTPLFSWPNLLVIWLIFSLLGLTACQPQPPLKQSKVVATSGFGGTGNIANSGFGGTGQIAKNTGFGGTGIIGTITDFGSIWVNGIEVYFSESAPISSNIAPKEKLQIGQQVVVETVFNHTSAWVDKIYIHYPIAGKIEHINPQYIIVDGRQVIRTKDTRVSLENRSLKIGQMVAINGYLSTDKIWQATLITNNPSGVHIYAPKPKNRFSGQLKKLVIETTKAQLDYLPEGIDKAKIQEISLQMENETRMIITADIEESKGIFYQVQPYPSALHSLQQQSRENRDAVEFTHSMRAQREQVNTLQEQSEMMHNLQSQNEQIQALQEQSEMVNTMQGQMGRH